MPRGQNTPSRGQIWVAWMILMAGDWFSGDCQVLFLGSKIHATQIWPREGVFWPRETSFFGLFTRLAWEIQTVV